MYQEAIALWDKMNTEDKFRFLYELDKKSGGSAEIGNGLRNLRYALVRKVEMVTKIGSQPDKK